MNVLEDYLRRSGDERLAEGALLQNDHGFMVYRIHGDSFCIMHCYGDGKYWDGVAEEMALKNGCSRIKFATRRNPRTFAKKYGYRLTGYVMEKEV